jgi:hypothetical protein
MTKARLSNGPFLSAFLVSVWPTAIGAHPLLCYNSCQTFGKAFSGFALPCYLFFL